MKIHIKGMDAYLCVHNINKHRCAPSDLLSAFQTSCPSIPNSSRTLEITQQYCQKPLTSPRLQGEDWRGAFQLGILLGTVDSIFASTRFMVL